MPFGPPPADDRGRGHVPGVLRAGDDGLGHRGRGRGDRPQDGDNALVHQGGRGKELGPVGAVHNEPSDDPCWRVPGGVPVPDRLGRAVRQREHASGAGACQELLPGR